MELLETLALIAFIGFLSAAVFALKTHFNAGKVTNVWMLFSSGFAALALGQLTMLLSNPDSLAFLSVLKDSFCLTGIALMFSAMAVYYKEKRICKRVYRKKVNGEEMDKQIRKFADGL